METISLHHRADLLLLLISRTYNLCLLLLTLQLATIGTTESLSLPTFVPMKLLQVPPGITYSYQSKEWS